MAGKRLLLESGFDFASGAVTLVIKLSGIDFRSTRFSNRQRVGGQGQRSLFFGLFFSSDLQGPIVPQQQEPWIQVGGIVATPLSTGT